MIVKTRADFQKMLDFVKTQKRLAYDIETSGLEYRKGARIIGIGLSNSSSGFYLPLRSYDSSTDSLVVLPTHAFVQELLQALKSKELLAFNGAFDIPFTAQEFGVDLLSNLHTDVLLLKHTVDEEYPFRLKEIAVQVFGYGASSSQRDLHAELKAVGAAKAEIYKANYETIGKYCIKDCVLTYRLYNHYIIKLRQENLEQFFYKDEVMPLYKQVTIPMSEYGIALDLPLMQSTLTEISNDIAQIETKIQSEIAPLLEKFEAWFLNKDYPPSRSGTFAQGIAAYANLDLPRTASGKYSLTESNLRALPDSIYKSVLLKEAYLPPTDVIAVQRLLAKQDHGEKPLFNLLSKHHLKKLFFDTLELEPLSRTDLGNPQVDDEFIHSIADKYSWAMDLHVFNKLQKIRSTYIERFLEEQIDGVFYPSFFQHRTISGRFGSDLQQLPRKVSEKDEPNETVRKYVNRIRDFFIARPGCKLIGADYESLEPHIFAHVSGDERLQDIFRKGLDFYSEVAIRTENLQQYSSDKSAENYLGKVAKEIRQRAKSYALGIAYGMSGYKLQFELGCSQEEAELLVEKYLTAFPDLKKWMDDSKETLFKYGAIASQAGRIRHMPKAKQYIEKYGLTVLDSLQLYKDFGHDELLYAEMKKIRKELQNYINNSYNFQIQSLAASIVNRAAIAIAAEFKQQGIDAQICMNVHDELVVECPANTIEQVSAIMQRIMENIMPLSLPLKAEPQVADKYGDTK